MTEKPKLLDQVRQVIPVKNYSHRSDQAYVSWIKRYILHHDKRHPAEMGEPEVESLLMAQLMYGAGLRVSEIY